MTWVLVDIRRMSNIRVCVCVKICFCNECIGCWCRQKLLRCENVAPRISRVQKWIGAYVCAHTHTHSMHEAHMHRGRHTRLAISKYETNRPIRIYIANNHEWVKRHTVRSTIVVWR